MTANKRSFLSLAGGLWRPQLCCWTAAAAVVVLLEKPGVADADDCGGRPVAWRRMKERIAQTTSLLLSLLVEPNLARIAARQRAG